MRARVGTLLPGLAARLVRALRHAACAVRRGTRALDGGAAALLPRSSSSASGAPALHQRWSALRRSSSAGTSAGRPRIGRGSTATARAIGLFLGLPPPGALALVVAVLLARAARAQDPVPEREVALVVTAVSDRSVYLDHGRDVGLAVGTFVRLFPPGAGELEVEVRAITQTSARADLPPGVPLPPVGTRGEARVAPPRAATDGAGNGDGNGNGARAAPRVHPPWSRAEDPRTADQPLLVPAYRQRPDQRPMTLDGRLFAALQHSREHTLDSEYWLGRLGARADATNVLGEGERWRGAGELALRDVAVPGDHDETDVTGRLDLFSVAFGTEAWAPTGVELGRFHSAHLPELGLVDGVEVVRRYRGGVTFGGGLGTYPRPFPARDAGDDAGFHLFADWVADDERTAAATVGFHKSWHRGEPDRDLILLRGEWRPAERVTLLASCKLDVYTGSDDVKGSGVEPTEAWGQARWDGSVLGTGVAASRFTWPELLRREYQDLPPELVRDGFVERFSWHGSWRPAQPLSLRVRADVWRDQDRDGHTLGADADWRGPWGRHSALSLGAFVNDGGYAAGPGARVTVRDRLGDASLRASYRWYRYELGDLLGGGETLVRESVEAAVSLPVGGDGDVELVAERWFGDREDATWFGLYLQWRW